MTWIARAPANIALIKYMGKRDRNVPMNVSLSYCLDNFTTEVILDLLGDETTADILRSQENLSDKETQRFLRHLAYIKHITAFRGNFAVKSRNNFPHSVGIASSASSFAALTLCAFDAICDIQKTPRPPMDFMSAVSREGSGSSCRSFFSPWCVWDENSARKIDIKNFELLRHDLALVSSEKKKISSSDAHKIVCTSLLMNGRRERAEVRFHGLVSALNAGNWQDAYQICWEEFSDMHAMFETSLPHFGYILPDTIRVLTEVRNFWKEHNDGPIATVDAGPNVHLLWRNDAESLRTKFNEKTNYLNLRK